MRQYTEAEVKAFQEAEQGLQQAGFDTHHEGSTHNANLTLEYFEKNLSIPVTVENIYALVNQRPYDFKWRTPAQREYDRSARQNPDLANALAAFLATQGGRPGQLVNDGSDEHFENLLLLFTEINARRESASVQTIRNAEDRIAHRPGKQLHRVPQPRRTAPISQAAKQDDGEPFLGRNVNMSPADYKRQADAFYAEKNPTSAKPKGPVDAWETLCNQLLNYGTHGAQAAMRQIYDRGVSQRKSFREIYAEMNELKKSRERLLPTARY